MKQLLAVVLVLLLSGCKNNRSSSISRNYQLKSILEKNAAKGETDERKEHSLKIETTYRELFGERIRPIRTNFKRISKITEWSSVREIDLYQSTEGGLASYYFLKDTLLKIVVIHFGEMGKSVQEFYTKNKQLSFTLEQQHRYNRPITWDSAAVKENYDTEIFDLDKSEIIEDSSYFENGILFRQTNNQDCGSLFTKEYLEKEQNRLKTEFKNLKMLLNN